MSAAGAATEELFELAAGARAVVVWFGADVAAAAVLMPSELAQLLRGADGWLDE